MRGLDLSSNWLYYVASLVSSALQWGTNQVYVPWVEFEREAARTYYLLGILWECSITNIDLTLYSSVVVHVLHLWSLYNFKFNLISFTSLYNIFWDILAPPPPHPPLSALNTIFNGGSFTFLLRTSEWQLFLKFIGCILNSERYKYLKFNIFFTAIHLWISPTYTPYWKTYTHEGQVYSFDCI